MINDPDTYEVDRKILRELGPAPAVVLAIIVAMDDGIGTTVSHKQLAKAAGIPHIRARRCIEILTRTGLLKAEAQYQGRGQVPNSYRVPTTASTPAHSEQGAAARGEQEGLLLASRGAAHIEQPLISKQVLPRDGNDIDTSLFREPINSPTQRLLSKTPGVNRSPGTGGGGSSQFPQLVDLYADVEKLTAHFEGLVLLRMNQERRMKGWKNATLISETRKGRWEKSAVALLLSHPLEEVVGVVNWIFQECDGQLPRSMWRVECNPWPGSRKVTNLRLVLDFYDELVHLKMSRTPKSVETPPNKPAKPPRTGVPNARLKTPDNLTDLLGLAREEDDDDYQN